MVIIASRLIPTSTTVGTTATVIPATAASGRLSIAVFNNGSNTVFLGDSGVTTSTGFPLEAGASQSIDLGPQALLYGRTSTGSSDVRSLEGV